MVKMMKDRYDFGLDWDQGTALVRWPSAFWQEADESSPGFEISSLPS